MANRLDVTSDQLTQLSQVSAMMQTCGRHVDQLIRDNRALKTELDSKSTQLSAAMDENRFLKGYIKTLEAKTRVHRVDINVGSGGGGVDGYGADGDQWDDCDSWDSLSDELLDQLVNESSSSSPPQTSTGRRRLISDVNGVNGGTSCDNQQTVPKRLKTSMSTSVGVDSSGNEWSEDSFDFYYKNKRIETNVTDVVNRLMAGTSVSGGNARQTQTQVTVSSPAKRVSISSSFR